MTDKGLSFKDCSYISKEEFQKAKKSGACPEEDTVLFSKDGTVGKVHVVRNSQPFAVLSSIAILRPDARRVDSRFLGFALQHPRMLADAESRKTGSALRRIILEDLKQVRIPLPSLPEQHRITGLLEKADHLRRNRRYTVELSGAFLSSAFLKLFGDPISNPKGWPEIELGEQLDFITSGSRGWATHYAKTGDMFLRIQNVGRGRLLLDDVAFVQPPDDAEAKRTKVRAGDVLLSITADLGRSASIPPHFPSAYINQHLALLRPRGLNPVFLAALLSSDAANRKWSAIDREGVKSGLNFDDVMGFKIVHPPDELQERYARMHMYHERILANQREAMRQAEHLFQSLLHHAFMAGLC
jgi:type I restriction enzyme S subunit